MGTVPQKGFLDWLKTELLSLADGGTVAGGVEFDGNATFDGTVTFNGTIIGLPPTDLVNDLTPQLGGDLDANGFDINMGVGRINLFDANDYFLPADNNLDLYLNSSKQWDLSDGWAWIYQDWTWWENYINLNAGAGHGNRRINFQTSNNDRWRLGIDASAESGSDVGSDFYLYAYDDAGSYIDNPLHINREAGGWVTFNRTVQVSGGLAETLLYFDADLGVNNDRYLSLSAPNSDSTTDSFDWNTANSVAWLVDGSTTLRLNSNKNVEVLAGDLEVDRVGDADDAHLILNSDVGKWSRILFESNDLNRWRIGKDISTESGSNVGSDFRIDAYDDVGAFIDTPIEIQREAGGNIDFSRDVYMNANDFYTEAGLIYGANTNDYLDLASGDLGIYVNSVRRLRVQSGRFYSDVPFYLKEAAAAGGDVAAYGQLWVKNTTPCQLWFTDDTGTDTQIV
jgi:hypothetical protein